MTREEIAKALRACSSDMPCSKCPAYYQKTDLRCVDYMMMCAADMLEQADHFADTGKMVPLTLDELPHNPDDIDEICALRARVENLTLYLQEAFALCNDDLEVLNDWHPGLPGYAPPQECKRCKIDD